MGKFAEFFGNVVGKLQALSKVQKTVAAVVTASALAVVGGGAVLVSSIGNTGSLFETETTENAGGSLDKGTEIATEVIHEICVKLETSSIDKDLKVKVVDENGQLVSGYEFEIEVAQVRNLDEKEEADEELVLEDLKMEDYDSEKYVDDDKDGMIHILNLEGGDYLVSLTEMEEIIIEQNMILAEVKGKLEYKKVDVTNEIKNESQINAAVEDTAINNVVVESVVTDTLPLLPTTVTSSEVARDQVDTSNFPKASRNEDYKVSLSGKLIKYCTSHVEVETNENVENATCTQDGSYTVVKVCSICSHKEIGETITVPAVAHTEGTPVEEYKDGSYVLVTYCSVCGEKLKEELVEVPESSSTEPSIESTNPTLEETDEPDDVTTKRYMGGSIVAVAASIASENTTTGTPYTVEASATIGAPSKSEVYLHSKETEKITWALTITDEHGVVDKANIKFAVDHTDVANLVQDKDDPTKITITGYKAGTANIIIYIPIWTVDANGNKTITYHEMASVVTVDNYEGEKAVYIKDKAGNPLYIDSDCTKPATPAHYTNIGYKLYSTPKYTGWTVIDGKLYYYKEDNTPATGSQVIGGVQYTFNSDGTLQAGNQSLGIDVSKWQGSIDWTAVANSGVKFAIIRCAYRGASTGVIVEDPYFRQNIQGASANGIKIGVYFFTQAINEYEAVEEASTAIGLVSGYNLTYPIFIDTESASNGRANGLDVATRTAVVKAFCETVRNAGYKPGIYASKSWYNSKLDMSQLSTYNIWVAQYSTSCTYGGRYDIWQYTSSGSIPGINGNVDLNIGYTNY